MVCLFSNDMPSAGLLFVGAPFVFLKPSLLVVCSCAHVVVTPALMGHILMYLGPQGQFCFLLPPCTLL
jgi:hypothetical protein